MEQITQLCFCSLLISILFGCTPEASETRMQSRQDVMDISTWDFGDGATTHNRTVLHQETPRNEYSIAVATFTGDSQMTAARSTLSMLVMQYPSIARRLQIRERSRGTVITYGQYTGFDDPTAKQDIDMLRSIPTAQGSPLFRQILLSKFRPPRSQQVLHPHDLWTVRREFPMIVPIYTLEVAVWGDFDSGKFPRDRRRTAAQNYVSDLRAKGFDAYFYHNDDKELSSVTVGLFGFTAIDAETGFYSPEVEAVLARFPERLVNGQPILEYLNPNNPSLGTKVQRPCLAEVPVD